MLAATAVAVPPQLLASPFGVETTRPDGRLSVKPTPACAPAFALVMVKVSVVLPFTGIAEAPNASEIDSGPTTVRVAVAVLPEPPSFEVTALVVLFLVPAVAPVTLTVTAQSAEAAKVPPDRLM